MRLDFTSHTGSANPNSEQDTIMILRFKISNGLGVFGNGDAYYIGGIVPNPSYFRIKRSDVDANVILIYARMNENSNGSCVTSRCNNFTFVGEIIETPPALSETHLTQITPYSIFASRDFQSAFYPYTQLLLIKYLGLVRLLVKLSDKVFQAELLRLE